MSEKFLAHARALLAAFAANDRNAYFSYFAPDATFLFHTLPHILPNRAAYEAEYDLWVERSGFRVISFHSHRQRIAVFGSTAIFTHESTTQQVFNGEDMTLDERETIILTELDGEILAVHEHLSLA